MKAKYTLKPATKRKYHHNSTMSKEEIMLIMIHHCECISTPVNPYMDDAEKYVIKLPYRFYSGAL